MWGKPADTLHEKPRIRYGTSHKWHLVDPDSLEEREVSVGVYGSDRKANRIFGMYMCGGKKQDWYYTSPYTNKTTDQRTPLIIKEAVNLNGSGICYYCKNFKLRELGHKERVMG